MFRCSRVLTAVAGCCFLPGGTVGCVVLFTADVLGCFLFSFPVDVVGCVLFCAWRIGAVAGVLPFFLGSCPVGGVWFEGVCCVILGVRS